MPWRAAGDARGRGAPPTFLGLATIWSWRVGVASVVERERPERGLRRHELHLDTAAWAGLLRLA